MNNHKEVNQEEKLHFVKLELSRKQVDFDHPKKNEKNGKDYVRILAPMGGVFFYPKESLKSSEDNPNKVFFYRPEGTEFTIYYSNRRKDVPDDAPNELKYENFQKTVKIEDLKEMYEIELQEFVQKNRDAFVNMMVPTSWGRAFVSREQEYISISIPFPEGDTSKYYSFIIPAERFRESEREEGMSYFGFPKYKKDSEESFLVEIRHDEKNPDGSYEQISKRITSKELKEAVDRAVDMYEKQQKEQQSEQQTEQDIQRKRKHGR